jgi:hypothetical protein
MMGQRDVVADGCVNKGLRVEGVSLDEYFSTTTTTVVGCHLDRVPLDVLKRNCVQHKYRNA